METYTPKNKLLLSILAILILIWGALGLADTKNFVRVGYDTDGNKTVTQILEGLPADQAGLQVGDYLLSIDGLSLDDTKAWESKTRPKVGETRRFIVQRDGQEVEMDITYASIPPKDKVLNYASFALGLIFLVCGLFMLNSVRSKAAYIFAVFGILFSLAFFYGPYFASPSLREFFSSLDLFGTLAGLAALLYFILNFPDPRPFLQKKSAFWWISLPAILFVLAAIIESTLDPEATSGLRTFFRLFSGFVGLYYFGWILLALIGHARRNSAQEREAKGLNILFLGILLGVLPFLLIIIADTFAPKMVIPGSEYAFLLFGLIPICAVLAIQKRDKTTAVS